MHFRDRIQILWFWRAKKEADPICLCIMRQKESWNNWQNQGRNKLCLLNEALYLPMQNYTDHVYTEIKVFKSRFANKRNRKWAFFAKSGEKNRLIVFWEKIRKLRPHLHRKKKPWSSSTKKASNVKSKDNVDLILLKTAPSLAEKTNNSADSRKKAKEEGSDDEDSFYCKGLAWRFRQLRSHKKAFCKLPNRTGHVSSTVARRRGIPKYSSK